MSENVTKIAHVSDLHFGDQSPLALKALTDALTSENPDALIVSGDLTQAGRKAEFLAARSFLTQFSFPLVLVPGNHDLPVLNLVQRFFRPYKRYQRLGGGLLDNAYRLPGVSIVGLNSARRAALDINWSFGRLSRSQITWAADTFAEQSHVAFKILAVHHPFVTGPGRAGSRIVGRGEETMRRLSDVGLDLALTGHVHVASAKLLEIGARRLVLVQAGTAASMRTRGEMPSFNIVRLSSAGSERKVDVQCMSLVDGQFEPIKSQAFACSAGGAWREAA